MIPAAKGWGGLDRMTDILSQGLTHRKLSNSGTRSRCPNEGLVALRHLVRFQPQELLIFKGRKRTGVLLDCDH